MSLIDAERATQLYASMPSGIESSGGSAANTMAGVASFGERAASIGKGRDDQLGEVIGLWKQVATKPDGGTYEVAGIGGSWFRYGGNFQW
ncbi:MAG: hypothetical protein WCP68_08345, partial [Enhydrobacter sp.]